MLPTMMVTILIAGAFVAGTYSEEESQLTFKCRRADDRCKVDSEQGQILLSIHSPTGISYATIERTTANWPDPMIVRLHLKGLESLKISNDKAKINASVSSHDGTLRVWMEGRENAPLNPEHPLWIRVRRKEQGDRPSEVKLGSEQAFELQLPKAFFATNPKSIRLDWIDFYRN